MEFQSTYITDILRRTEMGITRPFICRCDDNKYYVVKTLGAMSKFQIMAEFTGSCIAQQLGLPVPKIKLIHPIPTIHRLLESHMQRELGVQPAFGSEYIAHAALAKFEQAHKPAYFPIELQKRLYFLDRWISNSDRNASRLGTGNINLLFDPLTPQIWVIDHNLAFDITESESAFSEHLFAPKNRQWRYTEQEKSALKQQAIQILTVLPDLFESMPDEWMMEEADFSQLIYPLLNRIHHNKFWENVE